jgi:hypothetical protein
MLKEYKVKTNIGIGLALAIWVLGVILAGLLIENPTEDLRSVLGGIRLLGLIPFVYGCCCYAKGKGHSGAWGLLGLLWILGLIILFCFKDMRKTTMETSTTNSDDGIYKKGIS